MSSEELQVWMQKIVMHVHYARVIKVEKGRINYLTNMLHARHFTFGNGLNAEQWICFGDWRFKGTNPVFELADLFPTAEQLKSLEIQNKNIQVVTKEFLSLAARKYYELGLKKAEDNKRRVEVLDRPNSEDISLANQVLDLSGTIRDLQDDYDRFRRNSNRILLRIAKNPEQAEEQLKNYFAGEGMTEQEIAEWLKSYDTPDEKKKEEKPAYQGIGAVANQIRKNLKL